MVGKRTSGPPVTPSALRAARAQMLLGAVVSMFATWDLQSQDTPNSLSRLSDATIGPSFSPLQPSLHRWCQQAAS